MSLSLQEIETEVLNLPETEQLRLIDFFESLKIKITKQTQINFNSLHNKTVMSTEGERVLAILKETGFLGSMPDVPELSENYKDYLDWSDKV